MALEIWSMDFVSLIMMSFSIVMLLAGIFAAVFGTGKSRAYGGVIAVVGLAILLIWIYLCGFSNIDFLKAVPLWDVFINGIINLIGILIGALIAVGIFLMAVLKS